MKKPICLAVEGVDCAGKGTAARKACARLVDIYPNKTIRLVSFPQYDLPSGALIKKYLNGDYKDIVGGFDYSQLTQENKIYDGVVDLVANVEFAAKLYSINRAEYFHVNGIDTNAIYIFDRYMFSNITHQFARIYNQLSRKEVMDDLLKTLNPDKAERFIRGRIMEMFFSVAKRWINEETDILRLPSAHTLYLCISTDMAMERLMHRKSNKHDGKDILENRNAIDMSVRFIEWLRQNYHSYDISYFDVTKGYPADTIVSLVNVLVRREENET